MYCLIVTMTIPPFANKWFATTPIIIGILIGAGAVIMAMTIIISAGGIINPLASHIPQTEYPSIEIEMLKTTYQVGERLDFTVHTYGICATPNISIIRERGDGQWVTVYQYVASPFSCPSSEAPDQPHSRWKAEQLVQRISDENFGGDGNSVITTNAALALKQAGTYEISASLPDQSKGLSMSFTVIAPSPSSLTAEGITLGAPYVVQISWDIHEMIFGNSTDLSVSIKDRDTMEPLKEVTYDFGFKGLSEGANFQDRFIEDFSNPDKFRSGIKNPCDMHLTIFVDKVGDQSFMKTDPDVIAKYGNTSSVVIQFRTSPMDESRGCDYNTLKLALHNGYDLQGNRT